MAMFYFLLVVAYLVVMGFLQAGLSRRTNPLWGMIIPVICFSITFLATGAVTGGDLAFWRHLRWFLIANIPTVIYLIIFGIVRIKMTREAEFERLEAQRWD